MNHFVKHEFWKLIHIRNKASSTNSNTDDESVLCCRRGFKAPLISCDKIMMMIVKNISKKLLFRNECLDLKLWWWLQFFEIPFFPSITKFNVRSREVSQEVYVAMRNKCQRKSDQYFFFRWFLAFSEKTKQKWFYYAKFMSVSFICLCVAKIRQASLSL